MRFWYNTAINMARMDTQQHIEAVVHKERKSNLKY